MPVATQYATIHLCSHYVQLHDGHTYQHIFTECVGQQVIQESGILGKPVQYPPCVYKITAHCQNTRGIPPHLPTGLVSKKSTGALSTAPNILLCCRREALRTSMKKRMVRATPVTITPPTSPPYTPIRWWEVKLQLGRSEVFQQAALVGERVEPCRLVDLSKIELRVV